MENKVANDNLNAIAGIDNMRFLDEKDNSIFPIFYSLEEEINYSLITDGNSSLLDIRIDKWPGRRDPILLDYSRIYRHDFKVTDANLVLVERSIGSKTLKDLYVDRNYFESKEFTLVSCSLYQISFNSKGKYLIRRRESI